MNSRQRLLYVINDGAFFSAHFSMLAERARDSGYEVHVAAPEPGPLPKEITFHRLRIWRKGANPLRELVAALHIAATVLRVRPAIAHYITIKPVIYGGIVSRVLRTPAVVQTIPGLGYVFLATTVVGRALRAGVRVAYSVALGHRNGIVIFQNPHDREEFVSRRLVDAPRTRVIRGSGIDMAEFSPSPEPGGAPLVVLPARMLWDKGVGEFVAAAEVLKRRGVKARFALVGDNDPGNPACIPRAQLEEWRARGCVEWWGFRRDMPQVIAQAAVVCLPSYREGIPRALIEAAAAARPIVATDVPGCREVVRDGHNGLLVAPRTALPLADALEKVLSDPELRRTMGERGRALAVSELSADAILAETFAAYREVAPSCDGPGTRAPMSPP